MLSLGMEVFGWVGGLALISAYALVSFGKISARGALFQWLNLLGSFLLAANSAWHSAWPSVSVNAIWIGVGVAALVRGWFLKAQMAKNLDPELRVGTSD